MTILTLAMSKEEGGGGGGGQPPEQSHAQYVGPYRLEKTLGKGQTGRCWCWSVITMGSTNYKGSLHSSHNRSTSRSLAPGSYWC